MQQEPVQEQANDYYEHKISSFKKRLAMITFLRSDEPAHNTNDNGTLNLSAILTHFPASFGAQCMAAEDLGTGDQIQA